MTHFVNANGEREEKVEAREAAASASMDRRGVEVRDCPHCGLPLEVRLDGTPATCNYDHEGEHGCGATVTLAECAE